MGEEAIAASMQKAPLKGVSRRAGRKMNEHRAGPENYVMRTLTGFDTGKLPSRRKRAKRSTARVCRGIDHPEAHEGETGLHGMAERPY